MKSRIRPFLLTLLLAGFVAVFLAALGLVTAPAASAQTVNGCYERPPVVPGKYYVFGIRADDPDGGLVMRAGPGVQSPRIGVLPALSGNIWATGECWTSPTGSAWYQVWTEYGGPPVWVSSNFLRLVPTPPYHPPVLACQPGPCFEPVPAFGPPQPAFIPPPSFYHPIRSDGYGLVVCG